MTDGDGDDLMAGPIDFGPPGGDTSAHMADADPALLSRLELIDERPLADRAAAFRQLHDELRAELEASDGV